MTTIRAVFLSLSIFSSLAAVAAEKEPGVLLREGSWDGSVGTFNTPAALADLKPSAWPVDGWYGVKVEGERVVVTSFASPSRAIPDFLKGITAQVERAQTEPGFTQGQIDAAAMARIDYKYLRVPGVALKEGPRPAYKFRNGTPGLRPILDNRYELTLGSTPFAFTVQNGLRTAKGVAYGEGAHITIEYGGNKYEYLLGEYGWDTFIEAIADVDGDGMPDFFFTIGGSNVSYEAVLLSSVAKPGRNPPTASLSASGC